MLKNIVKDFRLVNMKLSQVACILTHQYEFVQHFKMDHKKYLVSKLVELLDTTDCNIKLMDQCLAKSIFCKEDKEKIWAQPTPTEKSSVFWSLVMTRPCMDHLIEIFGALKQQGVVDILIKAVRDDGSDSKDNFLKNPTKLEVKVTRPEALVEHQDDAYKLDSDTIGLALILNVIDYEDASNRRHGAVYDSEYMDALWTQFGYKVTKPKQTDFKAEDIRRHVSQLLERAVKLSHMQSLVVFIGCHEEDGTLVMSDGNPIDLYNDIVFKFDIPELRGKPKLFFIQACQYFPDNGNASTKSVSERLSSMGDTIVCFSTLPNHESNRNFLLGSFYIYTLTDVFMKKAYETELQNMLNLVQQKMASQLNSNDKQIPYHFGKPMKPLYFNVRPED